MLLPPQVYDFEAWTPIWENNDTPASINWHSKRYQDYSIALVKAKHPGWSEAQLDVQAKKEFEAAGECSSQCLLYVHKLFSRRLLLYDIVRTAMEIFVKTLNVASATRPKALWGYYGTP